ncbi:hypothetical protein D3C81_1278530 [compost metagenome]
MSSRSGRSLSGVRRPAAAAMVVPLLDTMESWGLVTRFAVRGLALLVPLVPSVPLRRAARVGLVADASFAPPEPAAGSFAADALDGPEAVLRPVGRAACCVMQSPRLLI